MHNMTFKRLIGENDDQYFYRICGMKESLGFTWPQMAEIFNSEFGCNKGDTAYRKRWNAFKGVFDANSEKIVGDNQHLDEIRKATYELEKARQKLQATKVEWNRNVRQESRSELFYENIRDAIQELPVPEIQNNNYKQAANKSYLLCIADIQAGAKFKIPGNEYSLEICQKRFNHLLSDMMHYTVMNRVEHMNVVGLGDTIQNILRITDLQLNETSVVDATVQVSRMIASFLNQLSAYCMVDFYHVPASNHGQNRLVNSKANELALEDMEYVIGHYIADMLRGNKRVTVHLNDGCDYIEIPIFNFNVMAMHGHTIKNLDTALRDMSIKHRKLMDYIVLGHYHSSRHIPGNEHGCYDTEVLVCPSFQGTDPYAFNKLGKSSKAACKLFVFDEQYGCTGTEKFILN